MSTIAPPLPPRTPPAAIAPAVPAGPPVSGPLSEAHLRELAAADRRGAAIRRAGGVALFNGCAAATFAGGCLLWAIGSLLFGEWDVPGLVVGVGLAIAARNEFRGRRLLRRFEPRGPRLLGWNQIGLMVLVIGYCAYQVGVAVFGSNPYAEAIATEPMLAGSLGPLGDLYKTLAIAVYGAVAVGTALLQSLGAAYYFTRGRPMRAYLRETPDWVVRLRRHSMGA